MKRLALRTLVLLLALASAQAQSRIAFARFELTGPMSEPVVSLIEGSNTALSGALLPGERLERVLPIAVSSERARGEPRWRWDQDPDRQGRARFLGWAAGFEQEWPTLPAGLRSRPRPPVEPEQHVPSPFLGCLLAGIALASLASQRRSRWAAPALGLLGCAMVGIFAGGGNAHGDGARLVLEGQSANPNWLEVRGAWERLALPADADNYLVTSLPNETPLQLHLPLLPSGTLEIRARETGLFAVQRSERGWGSIAPQTQDCADFSAVWWREEGDWSYRGAWRRGEPLPAPIPGPPPPGWLANGLPQGPRVCLARAQTADELWIRHLGP